MCWPAPTAASRSPGLLGTSSTVCQMTSMCWPAPMVASGSPGSLATSTIPGLSSDLYLIYLLYNRLQIGILNSILYLRQNSQRIFRTLFFRTLKVRVTWILPFNFVRETNPSLRLIACKSISNWATSFKMWHFGAKHSGVSLKQEKTVGPTFPENLRKNII